MNLKDIAKIANVSTSTVSRAINNQPRVSRKTKEKILKIIKKEGFIPDTIARSLKTKKTKTIGVIVPEIESPFYYQILNGIEHFLDKHNFDILLCVSRDNMEKEIECVSLLFSKKVDGIIIAPISEISEGVNLLAKKTIPFVVVDILQKNKNLNTIYYNHYDISNEATKYLIKSNHKQIIMVDSIKTPQTDSEFLLGYKDAMKRSKLPIEDYFLQKTRPTILGGYKVIKKLISSNLPFSAVITIFDYIAVGAYKAIKELGLNIPKDISIIGNNDTPLSRYIDPPLTTFRQPRFKLGFKSGKILIDSIQNPSRNIKKIIISSKFVIRDSVIKRKLK
jgi:LacI family transcriptional regulator